jgi:hypothetical protein
MASATDETQLHASCRVDNRKELLVSCRVNHYVGQ